LPDRAFGLLAIKLIELRYSMCWETRDLEGYLMADDSQGALLRTAENSFHSFYELVSDAIIVTDNKRVICNSNNAAAMLLGFGYEDLQGRVLSDLFNDLDDTKLDPPTASRLGNAPIKLSTNFVHRNGSVLDLEIKAALDPSTHGWIIAARDASRRNRTRKVRDLLIDCARLVGKPFLDETVKALSIALNARCVILGEVDPQNENNIQTVAFWADNERQPNFQYALKGTPCAEVATGKICLYREAVRQLFPDDQKLGAFDADSYLGAPLHSREGKLIGILAIFHDGPIDESLEPELTLELFAGRSGAEIERIRTSSTTEQLGRIVEDAASETFVFDADTLKFILVNRGARENMRYSMEELRNLTPIDIKPEMSPDKFMGLIALLKNGETSLLTFETVHRRRDGTDYDVSVKLQLLENESRPVFYAAIEDITERNATMRALQLATGRLDTILNNTMMAVLLMNDRQECIYMNDAAEKLTGFVFDEVQGRILHDIIHHQYPDGRPFPLHECSIDRALPEDNQVQGEETFVHKDGSFYPVAFTASPIRDVSGHAIGTVIEAKNIAEEIKSREALANFNAEMNNRIETALAERDEVESLLRHSQKMEAVGKLTGGVAHDFNNLLQVIGGNLDLLERDVAGNPRAQQRLEMASAGVQRGAKLAQQLLAFSRKQPLAPKVCNLGRLVRGLDDMLRRTLGERIDLETIVNDDLWYSFVDEAQLENAVLNLAINACDAIDEYGRLTIEVTNADVDEFYARQHPDMDSGHYVVLSVTDNGCGMSSDIVDRIFEPFFTTKEVGKGTGLGLSMVYGLVKQSGGHLNVYSEPGEGTTIKLFLPRSITNEEEAPERVQSAALGGNEIVLVVEDDDDVRSTVTCILNELGYTVLIARDAASGLAIIESGAKIDLVFSDVIMPGKVQSRDMTRRALELLPNVAILFTSGYTENSIVHDGRLDESVELLSKPYSRDVFARKLRDCLDAAHNRAQPPQKKLRILFVEDEVFIRFSGLEMLSELGHDATGAATATAALDLLEESAFDVLITDLGLPDFPGEELAGKAIAKWPHMKIVIATGYDAGGVSIPGLAEGGARWLKKPYSMSDIENVLEPGN